MNPTQEQVIAWAREARFYEGEIADDIQWFTVLATLAYEAGRKDENDACAKVGEFYVSASNTKNEPGIALVIKDYMRNIRARREQ